MDQNGHGKNDVSNCTPSYWRTAEIAYPANASRALGRGSMAKHSHYKRHPSALVKWSKVKALASHSSASYALYVGDAEQALAGLPDHCVDTCLTSPPYWGARDYDHPDQIGLEDELGDYIERLVAVFRQVKRMLTPYGTAWLNLGDKYLSGIGTVDGRPPAKGWRRNKQLSLVPFRVAIALQEDGWWVRNVVAWHKPNGMPISAVDRLSNLWEPVFLLSRNERYYFNLDAIRVPHKTNDGIERLRAENGRSNGKAKSKKELRKWLGSPRHRANIDGLKEIARRPNAPDCVELAGYLRKAAKRKGLDIRDVARILDQPFERVRHYFREDRIGSRLPPEQTWNELKELLDLDGSYEEAMAIEYGDNVFRNHPNGRNPGDVHSFAVAYVDGQHFATMPRKLADWSLRASLPKGGVCLDPFMGHGTTGHAALALGGRFLGVDVQGGYVDEFVRVEQDCPPQLPLQAAE
jgi:DNA modification methylase